MIRGKGIAVERAMAVAICGLFQEVEMMKVKMWITQHVLLRLHLVSREAVTEVM